jgi:hypothetical protein
VLCCEVAFYIDREIRVHGEKRIQTTRSGLVTWRLHYLLHAHVDVIARAGDIKVA